MRGTQIFLVRATAVHLFVHRQLQAVLHRGNKRPNCSLLLKRCKGHMTGVGAEIIELDTCQVKAN